MSSQIAHSLSASLNEAREPSAQSETVAPARAEHLRVLPGGAWALWRWCGLRSAGFPAHLVLKLACPESSRAADSIMSAEAHARAVQGELLEECGRRLDETSDEELRTTLKRAMRQLRKGRVPEDALGIPFKRLFLAQEDIRRAQDSFSTCFGAGLAAVSREIRAVVGDEAFRSAVLLQNPVALLRVERSLSSTPIDKRGFKERQNEELVASYLQRYCLKNDTIGFFGPVGWARLVDSAAPITVSPGPKLVASSSIYFENWCIETLASVIAENPAIRRWIAPRLLPSYYFDGRTLHSGTGAPLTAAAHHQRLLVLCDGKRTAKEIAWRLTGTPGFPTEESVYSALEDHEKRRFLTWSYDLPIVLHPDKVLRRHFARIGDAALREPAMSALDKLIAARDGIAHAFGDSASLAGAIPKLESCFSELTGAEGSRLGGKMYAGRTLFYQDCRRDVDVELGSDLIEDASPALTLLLTSARWFAGRVAAVCREAFSRAHRDMVQVSKSGAVEVLPFWRYLQFSLFNVKPSANLLTPIIEELQGRWRRVLGPPPAARTMEFKSAHLRASFDEQFATSGRTWTLAMHHSPDIMIAAASVEAIRRGEYLFVIGEVHVTSNTLDSSLFVTQHPDAADFAQAMQNDFSEPRPVVMFPRSWPRMTNRTAAGWQSDRNYHIEVTRDTIHDGSGHALPAAAFIVRNIGGELMVCSRDGRLQFDAAEFFGDLLSVTCAFSYDIMKVFNAAQHNPRIVVDRLVMARESWRFAAKSLDFIGEEQESERYLKARRWVRDNGLPRFAFFKVPVEVKPCYVDFESPIYVEILVKMIRRMLASDHASGDVLFTEMLPDHGGLWLADAQDNRYTSELRFIAKDLDHAGAHRRVR